jgi:alanine-synthesizing transaminase
MDARFGHGVVAQCSVGLVGMVAFSRRSSFGVVPNALTEATERARARGASLLSLIESNPTEVGLSLTEGELAPLLASPGSAHYAPEPFGLKSAREAACAELFALGQRVAPEHVLLTASTSEAYSYLFRLLCDPGDALLVPTPSYPLFDTLAQLENVELVPYRLSYDGEWHLDASALAQARTARTRGIIVVSPNNPTGHFLKRSELEALSSLGLPILSDEVFAPYGFAHDARRVSSALEAAQRTLVFRLGGLSKSVALPQLKLAWTAIAGPAALRDEAVHRLEHVADAYLSPGTPVQLALPELLRQGAPVAERIRTRCTSNLGTLTRLLAHSAAHALHVEGGWYAIVRLPALLDDDGWALALLEQDGVLVQPGYFYDLSDGVFIVLSLITPEPTFAEGVARIAARVREVAQ